MIEENSHDERGKCMKVVKESAHVQNSLEGAWKVISDSRNWAEAMPGFI